MKEGYLVLVVLLCESGWSIGVCALKTVRIVAVIARIGAFEAGARRW